MSAAVLAESNVTVYQGCLNGRKLRRPQIFPAQQPVHGPGADCGQEHALRIHPAVSLGRAAADEHGTRSTQRDQFVRIHGQIVGGQRTAVLDEVTGHPVVLAAREIFQLLAKVAPVKLSAAFA
jgi:hypothetical protein